MKPRPIKHQVLVRQVPMKSVTAGGLHVPQGSEDWPAEAHVLAIGPAVQDPQFEVGDLVLFKRQPDSALVPDSRDIGSPEEWRGLLMLDAENVLCVIEGEV